MSNIKNNGETSFQPFPIPLISKIDPQEIAEYRKRKEKREKMASAKLILQALQKEEREKAKNIKLARREEQQRLNDEIAAERRIVRAEMIAKRIIAEDINIAKRKRARAERAADLRREQEAKRKRVNAERAAESKRVKAELVAESKRVKAELAAYAKVESQPIPLKEDNMHLKEDNMYLKERHIKNVMIAGLIQKNKILKSRIDVLDKDKDDLKKVISRFNKANIDSRKQIGHLEALKLDYDIPERVINLHTYSDIEQLVIARNIAYINNNIPLLKSLDKQLKVRKSEIHYINKKYNIDRSSYFTELPYELKSTNWTD